ncbi:putative Ig domain-containing protein [Cellulomonas edaphi]|uniref:Ig domain-containing protein n=1 Tax=Cellulomonas edaphi TaxID=3053468 RepID=A0ABT7S9R2_9CELL|nr:putative Ig domain-containing protein [Cellulomons edaphi]MDM7832347.1 putative Ig domain-containing protein [Cellulomons edaphi]
MGKSGITPMSIEGQGRARAVVRPRIPMVLGLSLVAATLQVAAPTVAAANPAGTHLVINEFSGGNGAGVSATDEFVELYNPTSETITFTGTIQYKSATGTSFASVGPVTTFVVAPHGYWLVAGANYTGAGTPDSRYTFDASASTTAGGHIALTAATTSQPAGPDPLRVDLIGWGTANMPEGSAAPAHPSVGGSLHRIAGVDTDNNSRDFVARAGRSPRGSAQNGSVVITNPGDKVFPADTAISPITLTTTGGLAPITYSVTEGSLPAGLTLQVGGQISGTPTAPASATPVTVRSVDGNGDATFVTFSITVTGDVVPVSVAAPTAQRLAVGTAVTPFAFTASGGTPPYAYAVTSGSLPAGLTLDPSTGEVSGTPSEVTAATDVTVTVTDSLGATGDATTGVEVGPGTITSGTPTVDGTAPVVGDLLTASPGDWAPASVTHSYQWLADGQEIDGADGASLAVTEDLLGSVLSVRVTGTRPGYDPASHTSAGTAAVARPVTVSGPGSQSVAVGEAVTPFSFVASGGVPPYTYAVVDGTLPAGLALDARTGQVTGTPQATAPAADVTVAATDANGRSASAAVSVGVGPGSLTTSTPTIDDALPVVGDVLTADAGAWGPAPVELSYQWLADDRELEGETGASLTVTPELVGAVLSVRVTGTKGEHRSASTESPGTASVRAAVDLSSPGTQRLTVGSPIEPVVLDATGGVAPYTYAVTDGALPDGLELDADSGEIAGTPTTAAEASTVTVTAQDSDGHVASASFSVEVALGALTTATPSLSDTTPVVGDVLTVSPGAWGPAPVALSYQWLADGQPIADQTRPTLTVTDDLVGAVLSARMTGTKAQYTTASTTSVSTLPVLSPVSVTAPAHQDLTVGTTITPIAIAASGGVAPYTYAVTDGILPDGLQLDADTGRITGTPTTVTDASAVTVTVQDSDGHSVSASLSVEVAAGTLVTATPTLNDTTPVVGDVLTASPGTWGPGPVALSYQWLADGRPIADQNGTTLTVTADLVGAVLSVRVTGTKAQYESASEVSVSTLAVRSAVSVTGPGTQRLTVGTPAGPAVVGATGGVAPYSYAVTGGALPAGLALDPATGEIAGTPTTAAGASTVTVTVADAGGRTASATFSVEVARGTLTTTRPTLSDSTPVVGDALTVTAGSWGPAPVSLSYEWLADGHALAGRTGATLTVTSDLVGAVLSARVTGTKAQYETASLTSLGTAAVSAAPSSAQPQSVSLTTPARALVGARVSLGATATSGLAPALSLVSGACTLDAGTARLTAATPTMCVVRAAQGGNDLWLPAAPVERSIVFVAPTGDAFTVDGASATGARPLLDVLRNDPAALTLTGVSGARHGRVTVVDAKVRYVPAAGYRGTDSFMYSVRDAGGDIARATAHITVRNAEPLLASTRTTQRAGTSVTVTPVASDPNGDALHLTVTSRPAHVGVRLVGRRVVLTPDSTVSGVVVVRLAVSDGAGGSDTAIVRDLVRPVAVSSAHRQLTDRGTRVSWAKAPTSGARYEVLVDGKRACVTAASACTLPKPLGPRHVISVRVLGRDHTLSTRTRAQAIGRHKVLISTLHFRPGQSTLTRAQERKLAATVRRLHALGFTSVELAGFTDSSGGREHNRRLTIRRAGAVAAQLRVLGVDSHQLWFGPAHPVASNSTADGRAKNRRVEIRVHY